MSYSDLLRTHIRLQILKLLTYANGYDLNEMIVRESLGELGFRPSTDQLRTDLTWLQEQGLVTVTQVGDIYVAKLTQRGVDVAEGTATVPGVKRPGPEA